MAGTDPRSAFERWLAPIRPPFERWLAPIHRHRSTDPPIHPFERWLAPIRADPRSAPGHRSACTDPPAGTDPPRSAGTDPPDPPRSAIPAPIRAARHRRRFGTDKYGWRRSTDLPRGGQKDGWHRSGQIRVPPIRVGAGQEAGRMMTIIDLGPSEGVVSIVGQFSIVSITISLNLTTIGGPTCSCRAITPSVAAFSGWPSITSQVSTSLMKCCNRLPFATIL